MRTTEIGNLTTLCLTNSIKTPKKPYFFAAFFLNYQINFINNQKLKTMENKLELKHFAAYLAYEIEVIDEGNYECNKLSYYNYNFLKKNSLYKLKPILRPLSDLTKEIEHNGERFVPIEYFEIYEENNLSKDYGGFNIRVIELLESISKHNCYNDIDFLPNGVVKKLLEWHFDIFGLIEKGLAVDANTVNQ